MSKKTIFIGIDAGGTKTRLAATDSSGQLFAHWEGPGANLALLGPEQAAHRLRTLLSPLSEKFQVESLAVGMAGATAKEMRLKLQKILSQELRTQQILVQNDAMALLKGIEAGKGNRLRSE